MKLGLLKGSPTYRIIYSEGQSVIGMLAVPKSWDTTEGAITALELVSVGLGAGACGMVEMPTQITMTSDFRESIGATGSEWQIFSDNTAFWVHSIVIEPSRALEAASIGDSVKKEAVAKTAQEQLKDLAAALKALSETEVELTVRLKITSGRALPTYALARWQACRRGVPHSIRP